MDRGVLKTIRFSRIEAQLLEESAAQRNMTVSDVVRQAVVLWREQEGDRQAALEAWVHQLTVAHGSDAILTARVNYDFGLDVLIGDRTVECMSQAVLDGPNQLQAWVGDNESDARAFLGRLPVLAGASISLPVAALVSLGASDAHAV